MKNKKLKIIIILLIILVIGLSGYILYDKVLSKDLYKETEINKEEENNISNENNQENNNVELEEDLKKEISEIFKFVYNYYNWSNPYCGEYDINDEIEINKDGYTTRYRVSTKYKSYNEMFSHLQKYMTKHVIYGKYYMEEDDTYIEKNGKLYCADFQKGQFDKEIKKITIKSNNTSYSVVIYTTITIETEYSGMGNTNETYKETETYNVTFENKNNSWKVSSYEKQD